ncbi:MAG: transposase [Phycisphaerales bacterium]|nr:transposase [Phycisphaerales bacterium]
MTNGRGGTYLLTWTTYGTWLRGDERGFVGPVLEDGEYVVHNRRGTAYSAGHSELVARSRRLMECGEVVLNDESAMFVARACEEVCAAHHLDLIVGAVMRTHVHLVVRSGGQEGARLLQLFKGVASRRLGQANGVQSPKSWWTRHGSRRLLTNDASVEGAVRYVRAQRNVLAWCEPVLHRAKNAPD